MSVKKIAIALILLICLFGLGTGNVLHAVIPHEHAHEAAMWGILHQSLRHEDKQILFLIALAAVCLGALFFAIRLLEIARPVPLAIRIEPAHKRHESLRRGIVAYRTFR